MLNLYCCGRLKQTNIYINWYTYYLPSWLPDLCSVLAVVLTFYRPMPRATEFSDRATTDRLNVNTTGYKVRASMFSTVNTPGLVKFQSVYIPYIWECERRGSVQSRVAFHRASRLAHTSQPINQPHNCIRSLLLSVVTTGWNHLWPSRSSAHSGFDLIIAERDQNLWERVESSVLVKLCCRLKIREGNISPFLFYKLCLFSSGFDNSFRYTTVRWTLNSS